MEINLEKNDLLNIKLKKLLYNVDDYLRGKDSGLFKGTAATDGLLFATTAAVIGVLGLSTSMPSELSSITDISNASILNLGHKDMSLIQFIGVTGSLISFTGAFVGLEFSALSKIFRSIVGDSKKEISGYFDCVTKQGEEIIVSRHDIMKSVENETFHTKYDAIRIAKGHGFEDFYPQHGDIEPVAKLPYYLKKGFDVNAAVHFSQDIPKDIEIVRRQCFTETNNIQQAHILLTKINGIRDNYHPNDTNKALKIK